jgi:hypothetical protein
MNDGGPAFPRGKDTFGEVNDGMSLRDYFAAKALQGGLAGLAGVMSDTRINIDDYRKGMAVGAYAIADAMLAERAKQTE